MSGHVGNIEASFRGFHKGVGFIIRYFNYPDGYVAEVQVDGLRAEKDANNCWKTKDEAHHAGVELAQKLIEKSIGHSPRPQRQP